MLIAVILAGILGVGIVVYFAWPRSRDTIAPLPPTSVPEPERSQTALLNVLEDLAAAKNEAERARAYSEALLGSIGEGVIAIDPQGLVTAVNRAASDMLGYAARELSGNSAFELVRLSDVRGTPVPREKRPFSRALGSAVPGVFSDRDHFYRRKDGELVPVGIDSSPIILNGAVTGAIEVFRDISTEKQIDLAQNEFVSLASHQLRTPLTNIAWYTDLLLTGKSGTLNQAQQEYTSEIAAASKRMTGLIDSLLNVSRIELGILGIKPQPVDVVAICRQAVRDAAAVVARKNLHVQEVYEQPVITMPAEPNLMHVVAENLLSNAVKYTPDGGSVIVTVAHRDGRVSVSVADSGIGIPEAAKSRMYQRLFRADNARKADPDGIGLGLYLTKIILDRAGGAISFYLQRKRGGDFYGDISRVGDAAAERGVIYFFHGRKRN